MTHEEYRNMVARTIRYEMRARRRDMLHKAIKFTFGVIVSAIIFALVFLWAIAIYGGGVAHAESIKEDLEGGIKWEQAVPEFTEGEAMELMRVARAEAGNQGPEGQALVMRVILNRVEDGRFGSTIHDVITAPSQFSTVSSGA